MQTAKEQAQRQRWRPLLPAGILIAAVSCGAAILSSLSSCSVKPTPPPEPPQPITYEGVPEIRVLLTSRPVTSAVLATGDGYEISLNGRSVLTRREALEPTAVSFSAGRWSWGHEGLTGDRLALVPLEHGFVRVGPTRYRGALELAPADGETFRIINRLDLESYLAGVLPKELVKDWELETYAALAVAARTFALYHMRAYGPTQDFDVGAGQAYQVYGGMSAETDRGWRAVRGTHGIVLGHGPAGAEQIFMAQYSACCGGRVNGAGVIRAAADIEPLAGGQVCTDCRECRFYRWPALRIAQRDVRRALAQTYPDQPDVGDLKELRPATTTPYGRTVWLDVVGAKSTVRLRAEDLRLALLRCGVPEARQLYSMNCRIRVVGDFVEFYDGAGFGHGVGLCQWGAQAKALRGASAQEILEFYYPGAVLLRAY